VNSSNGAPSSPSLYHVGYATREVILACAMLSDSLGVLWTPPLERTFDCLLGRVRRSVTLRFAFTVKAPHIEVVTCLSEPGTFWETDEILGPQHLGFWSSELVDDARKLETLGYE
jgi:hypothetical protein